MFAALNTCVPKVNCKHANHPPWITNDLVKAINKKKTLWRGIKNSKTPAKMENFRETETAHKKLVYLVRSRVGGPAGVNTWTDVVFIFINDMPNTVSSARIALFSDDSKCYKIIGHEYDFVNLQQDLDALFAWPLCNELYFQPAKCKNVRISRNCVHVSPPVTYLQFKWN